jgi:CheY-like chemotaxis protein
MKVLFHSSTLNKGTLFTLNFQSMTIKVLIEDNIEISENIVEILNWQTMTYFVQNGKQGVEMATMNLPDIILSDIMMPDLDGYGVLYLLNKNPETTTIPFILLHQNRVDLRKGMEMGADDYLTKPFAG